jgi:hypothetical protein
MEHNKKILKFDQTQIRAVYYINFKVLYQISHKCLEGYWGLKKGIYGILIMMHYNLKTEKQLPHWYCFPEYSRKQMKQTLIDNVGLWSDIYIATRRQYTG